MASFIFRLGSLDLSDYVRVGPQDGMDPYGQGWEEPQFSQSAVTEGNGFISLDVRNREMVWPIYLKSTTKDLLHTLKQQVVRESRYGTRPLRIEWRDDGATTSTFYDVAWARLDEKYNFRLGQKEYADAGLRVWCQPPYGHTASQRIVATQTATRAAIATLPVPSIAGDVEALPVVNLNVRDRTSSASAIFAGYAVLPHGYEAFISPSRVASGGFGFPTPVTALPDQIGQARTFRGTISLSNVAIQHTLSASAYSGLTNRVLLMVACPTNYAATLHVSSVEKSQGTDILLGPTQPVLLNGRVQLIDLGVWRPTVQSATRNLQFTFGKVDQAVTASYQVQFSGLMLLPEERTTIVDMLEPLAAANGTTVASLTLDTAHGSYVHETVNVNVSGQRRDLAMRTGPQKVRPQASETVAPFWLTHNQNGGVTDTNFDATIRVRERFTFAR